MTTETKPARAPASLRAALAAAVGVLALATVVLAFVPGRSSSVRTIELVADRMAFRLAAGAPVNPTIVAEAGEALRLVLVQQDSGFEHDLVLPGLDLATPRLRHAGERAELRFDAPDRPGDYTYVCSLHDTVMRGVLRVR